MHVRARSDAGRRERGKYQCFAMMGFCRIFFLEGPFWRFLGIDDRFLDFWSSRPILSRVLGGMRVYGRAWAEWWSGKVCSCDFPKISDGKAR